MILVLKSSIIGKSPDHLSSSGNLFFMVNNSLTVMSRFDQARNRHLSAGSRLLARRCRRGVTSAVVRIRLAIVTAVTAAVSLTGAAAPPERSSAVDHLAGATRCRASASLSCSATSCPRLGRRRPVQKSDSDGSRPPMCFSRAFACVPSMLSVMCFPASFRFDDVTAAIFIALDTHIGTRAPRTAFPS